MLYEYYETEDDVEHDIQGYKILWETLAETYDIYDCVFCVVIVRVMISNHIGHGFLVSWGEMLRSMIWFRTVYARGPCLLAMLYF